jgi:hypothetical protein
VADARLSAHLGVAEDYALFRKVTGTAAIQQAVSELNARLAEKGVPCVVVWLGRSVRKRAHAAITVTLA